MRQTDPVRGHSPWQRGVRGSQQVLVCPDCQAGPEWLAELDRCWRCDSIRLVCRLGEVECRDCGFVTVLETPGETSTTPGGGSAPGLAEEVALALDKVLGRVRGRSVARA